LGFGEGKGEYKERGETPLKNSSPSPLKERGIKGERLENILLEA